MAYRTSHARLQHVQCAYGGTGASAPGHYSISLTFDIIAASALHLVRMIDFEVLDGVALIARIAAPIELRVWLPGLDEDHNERTAGFLGAINAGSTIRLRARGQLTPMPADDATIARYRYRASLEAGTPEGTTALTLEGPLDQTWPTAGPAPIQ